MCLLVERRELQAEADCGALFRLLHARGVEFLADPVYSGFEIRAFFRDPDGHLFEISELKRS